jgi:hypothetical protein
VGPLILTKEAPSPPILLDRPVSLFHLEPASRRASLVWAKFVFRHVAFVPALDDLRPGLEAIRCEPTYREHEIAIRDDVLKPRAAITQRQDRQVAALVVQQGEGHEERRRGDGVRVSVAEPLEPGPEPPARSISRSFPRAARLVPENSAASSSGAIESRAVLDTVHPFCHASLASGVQLKSRGLRRRGQAKGGPDLSDDAFGQNRKAARTSSSRSGKPRYGYSGDQAERRSRGGWAGSVRVGRRPAPLRQAATTETAGGGDVGDGASCSFDLCSED